MSREIRFTPPDYQDRISSRGCMIEGGKIWFSVRKPCLAEQPENGPGPPLFTMNPSSFYIPGDIPAGAKCHLGQEAWHVCEGNSL